MKTQIAIRQKKVFYNALLWLVAFTFLTNWLPLLRAPFDGESYQWGHTYFGISLNGKGLTLDYFTLIIEFLFYGLLFHSVYWAKNRKLFYGLATFWLIHVFGNLFYEFATVGAPMFHGDTLNVHVSLSTIVIPLAIVSIFLVSFIIWKDGKLPDERIPWSKTNTLMALFILGPLPIQAILFRIGESHGTTDQIAVIMAILQCFLIPLIVIPRKKS